MKKAGIEAGWLAFETTDGVAEFVALRVQVGVADIVQLRALEVLPDAFFGIQVGGITRQQLLRFQQGQNRCKNIMT